MKKGLKDILKGYNKKWQNYLKMVTCKYQEKKYSYFYIETLPIIKIKRISRG